MHRELLYLRHKAKPLPGSAFIPHPERSWGPAKLHPDMKAAGAPALVQSKISVSCRDLVAQQQQSLPRSAPHNCCVVNNVVCPCPASDPYLTITSVHQHQAAAGFGSTVRQENVARRLQWGSGTDSNAERPALCCATNAHCKRGKSPSLGVTACTIRWRADMERSACSIEGFANAHTLHLAAWTALSRRNDIFSQAVLLAALADTLEHAAPPARAQRAL